MVATFAALVSQRYFAVVQLCHDFSAKLLGAFILLDCAVVGLVAGERHISAHKVSLVAGSAAASLMGLSSLAAPLLGVDPWSLLSVEGAAYTFVTAWAAGMAMLSS